MNSFIDDRVLPPRKFLPCGYPDSAGHKDRFWSKVKRADGCWLWHGKTHKFGYGMISYRGQEFLAHRVAYEFKVGPIPEGLIIRHRCDMPPCVNPEHLETGTQADNVQDAVERGRMTKGSDSAVSKLVESQVAEIRARYSGGDITQKELAAEFGITISTINSLLKGKTWKHVELGNIAPNYRDRYSKLDEDKVRNARAQYAAGGVTQQQLADKHGVGLTTMHQALTGRNWSSVE